MPVMFAKHYAWNNYKRFSTTAFIVPAQQEKLAKLFFQSRQIRFSKFTLANEIAKQEVSDEEIQA